MYSYNVELLSKFGTRNSGGTVFAENINDVIAITEDRIKNGLGLYTGATYESDIALVFDVDKNVIDDYNGNDCSDMYVSYTEHIRDNISVRLIIAKNNGYRYSTINVYHNDIEIYLDLEMLPEFIELPTSSRIIINGNNNHKMNIYVVIR